MCRGSALRHRRAVAGPIVVLAALLVLLSGCQIDVRVDTVVEDDGSGTVTVAVGLDDAALARVGDPDATFHVDDLRAAGWTVAPAERDGTDVTWVRATKAFSQPSEAGAVMTEITGPDGPLRDVALTKDASVARTTWRFAGTVDLTDGLAAFSDPEVAAALGGDPFGGNVQVIEAEEGRPATEMIDVTMTVDLPGADVKTFTPAFADAQPTSLATESTELFPVPFLGGEAGGGPLGLVLLGAVAVAVVVALVALRRRFVGARR